MPDPLLYSKAMGASAALCALLVLAVGWTRRPASNNWLNFAGVLGMSGGLALGYYLLRLRIAWPPQNGLDRMLVIVFPAVIGIECFASWDRVPSWFAWLLRLSLAAACGRILLHGSVYLLGQSEWATWRVIVTFTICGLLLALVWRLLFVLSERSPGVAIPLSLALAAQSAGISVMLAGYIKGGVATIPLTATLVVAGIIVNAFAKRSSMRGVIGIGVVGLFGLLFIGRYFGRLSTGDALTILLAPLLCWACEIPLLRRQKRWIVETVRLLVVAVPLVVVLVLAKREFDRHMAPLLSEGTKLHGQNREPEGVSPRTWIRDNQESRG